jgi:hypothetical protein
VIDLQFRAPHIVELRINQESACFGGVPVLADPVVFEERRIEIGAETAPGPSWSALGAQYGDKKQHELMATSCKTLIHRSCNRKRPVTKGKNAVQHFLYRTDMNLGLAFVGDVKL